jgi:hypothetical protein
MKRIAMVALICVLTAPVCVLTSPEAHATITIYRLKAICTWDIQQYCKGIRLTLTKQLKECLARHERELLPYCQDHYKQAF